MHCPWMRSPGSLYRYSPLKEVSFPGGSAVKDLPANEGDTGDTGSIPRTGRSPGVGNGNPLQYFCLENPHGPRNPEDYSPWGCKVSDMTEVT